jgi:hypothetical protein
MDAVVQVEKRFLPALADAVADWFPELEGRSVAVSDSAVTKENVPTLPLVVVALARSTSDPPTKSRTEVFDVVDSFVVEFWLAPVRGKKRDGTELPFWSYYPYEYIRDNLLTNVVRWTPPEVGMIIAYRSMTIEADQFAVTITFSFDAHFRWCPSKPPDRGSPFTIGFGLCPPESCCPQCDDKEDDPCNPCP